MSIKQVVEDQFAYRIDICFRSDRSCTVGIKQLGSSPVLCAGNGCIGTDIVHVPYAIKVDELHKLSDRVVRSVLQDENVLGLDIKAEIS